MRFKVDWASRIVGSKFTVFALFYFAFESNFPSTSPWGANIWRGDFTEGFLRYRFGWLVFGGLIFGFYGMTIIPFDNTTSVTLKMYLRFWRSMAMTRAHAHQVATLLEETPHSYPAFSFPLTSGREHAQYGKKTRGTRLKNGESGKKRKKLKTIFLRPSSLNMAGKLQALRKWEGDGDATGWEIRIKPLTVSKAID